MTLDTLRKKQDLMLERREEIMNIKYDSQKIFNAEKEVKPFAIKKIVRLVLKIE
jgi:hypothetical protein